MSRKIKFVLPTLFHRKEIEIQCVETICHQALKHNPENEVHMVCNFESIEFDQWKPEHPQIQKHVSHLMHSISKALNVVAKQENTNDFDYFCFVQSDVFFEDETWIEKCIEVYETHGNVGVIGIRAHSAFKRYHKQITNIRVNGINEMYEVLWSDGIMFFSTKLFNEIGYFDERFFGDCESNDFCYSAFEKGYKNIYIPGDYLNSKHILTSFKRKSPKTELLLNNVERSQKLFFHKWEHMFKKYFQDIYEKQVDQRNFKMKVQYKYAIGIHVMFYEIEMLSTYVDGLLNLLCTVDNKENVYLDFSFNTSQFFEKIDTTKTSKDELVDRFEVELSRLKQLPNLHYKIIDDDNKFYTQTNYRREFNTKYCEMVDYLMWGETDSLFPKEAIPALEHLTPAIRSQGVYRFIACFADRKMWDNSWDVTVHPNYLNHIYDDVNVDNINQSKSTMTIDQMNSINSEIKELDIQTINYPKIDGSCLVLSSDLVKSGINIPPCFIHNDDESLSFMAQKLLGEKYVQVIFKNILKVHARRHPQKRMYIANENNPRGFCGKEKGDWWKTFKEMSQSNLNSLFNNTGKFYTYEDFKKRL